MNFYSLNSCIPIAFILGIFFPPKVHLALVVASLFLIIPFNHRILNRLLIFAVLGIFRGSMIDNQTESVYSYKRTSFRADIVDIHIKEHGTYLLLANLQYCHMGQVKKSAFNITKNLEDTYTLDTNPLLPKTGLMKLKPEHKIDFANIKQGHFIGRFMLPMPAFLPHSKKQQVPLGLLNELTITKHTSHSFKTRLRASFSKNLSSKSAQLGKAILLGDTFAIEQKTRLVFQNAGIAHLLGVSVLNIAIISAIFYFLIRKLIGLAFANLALRIPLDIVCKIGALGITAGYCFLVGFEYPLLRSLLMSSFALISLYFGRNRMLEALLYSACLILIFSPNAIFNMGFQLSFGAVLGLCCAPSFNNFKIGNWKIQNRILKFFSYSIMSTFFASLVIIPISLFHFHTTSIQPFLANIISIPFVSFVITPVSLAYILIDMLNFTWILPIFSWILNYAFITLIKIAEYTAPFGFNIHIDPIAPYGCIILVLCLTFFAIFKEKFKYIFLVIGISAFTTSIIFRPKKPLLLIHPYAIGLILDDKIVVYPKRNFISEIWEDAYSLRAIDGRGSPYFSREKSGKIIVHYDNENIGLIFTELKESQKKHAETEIHCSKHYIIPYGEQIKGITQIALEKK
jgi:ComEC/Rec2-related protein